MITLHTFNNVVGYQSRLIDKAASLVAERFKLFPKFGIVPKFFRDVEIFFANNNICVEIFGNRIKFLKRKYLQP